MPSLCASVQVKRTVKALGTMVNDRLDMSDEIAYRIASVASEVRPIQRTLGPRKKLRLDLKVRYAESFAHTGLFYNASIWSLGALGDAMLLPSGVPAGVGSAATSAVTQMLATPRDRETAGLATLATPRDRDQALVTPRLREEANHASGTMPSRSQTLNTKSIGHYVLGKTLGEGTFGKVKLARHILSGEPVAIKVLEKERITEAADIERISREVHILKLIKHTHVVQLYEIIETSGQLYLIMEYASGGELFDYIVARQDERRKSGGSGGVEEREACRFFHQIVAGVEKIHAMGVAHRDLKPENLLLDRRLILLVPLGNTFKPGELLKTACGSPCYAPPEMVANLHYVPALADMWSCGVILFALICGYLPFEDEVTSQLYKKILRAEYTVPSFISEGGKDFQDLISCLLQPNSTQRYTIPDVRGHRWYQQVDEASLEQPDKASWFDEDTLCELEALKENKHNHMTTTYYLLLKRRQRGGGGPASTREAPQPPSCRGSTAAPASGGAAASPRHPPPATPLRSPRESTAMPTPQQSRPAPHRRVPPLQLQGLQQLQQPPQQQAAQEPAPALQAAVQAYAMVQAADATGGWPPPPTTAELEQEAWRAEAAAHGSGTSPATPPPRRGAGTFPSRPRAPRPKSTAESACCPGGGGSRSWTRAPSSQRRCWRAPGRGGSSRSWTSTNILPPGPTHQEAGRGAGCRPAAGRQAPGDHPPALRPGHRALRGRQCPAAAARAAHRPVPCPRRPCASRQRPLPCDSCDPSVPSTPSSPLPFHPSASAFFPFMLSL
ncbi:unnamed protein product [Prorocentrum cordatum]|uniref:Protein kinase domain-containing protein n=1 Tax=Prorocentrum cordatum TaxID=2364126 RepID=A0ABN9V6C0_9DINO|nr:unnamed protein product [Polarella glacialis]